MGEGKKKERPKASPFDSALRILGVRDHSKHELSEKLSTRGYEPDEVAEVIARLVELDYLSDERFAKLLMRSHPSLGRRGLVAKMKKHHIDESIWSQLVEAVDFEEERARALALGLRHTKLEAVASQDRARWQRKLGGYLSRRGFSMEVIRSVFDDLQRRADEQLQVNAEGLYQPFES